MAEARAPLTDGGAAIPRKAGYHHGHLKGALIDAAYRLIAEHGPADFAMADACRLAGVSPAAPYRHFSGRDDVLRAVAIRGFERLSEMMRAAKADKDPGSVAAIAAVGRAYVDFACEAPELFRMMFSATPTLRQDETVMACGHDCFDVLLQELRTRHGEADPAAVYALAFPLWTFVHGAAFLRIDSSYDKFVPGHDVAAMIETATRQLLDAV